MADDRSGLLPADTPAEVQRRAQRGPRVPVFDPTLGIPLNQRRAGTPPHRLVAIGDSLTHGFQSGAVFRTALSYPAILAHELGWFDHYRYPRYPGAGGLPLNLELLLRELEERFGARTSVWELPLALFAATRFLDTVEDYWERGRGATPPVVTGHHHPLAVFGWDLRDALDRTTEVCERMIRTPRDNVLAQQVENAGERAALRVLPRFSDAARRMSAFDSAAALGGDHGPETDEGIETLVVFLGANNALQAVTRLDVLWSGPDYADLVRKSRYTVWTPTHFRAELEKVVTKVRAIAARHVIWCTVPHVTIAPIARGVGEKVATGSRYFPYYTRPWVDTDDFRPDRHKHITGGQARAVDYAIDMYNEAIQDVVHDARAGVDGAPRDWYLLDIAGVLDRLASRRFIEDPDARPEWWAPYPLPAALQALDPAPDSHFLTGDGSGGRASGGLFSLDGVHPTTVGYGLIAQELLTIMVQAGVRFPTSSPSVDFERLLRHDTLIHRPPQNIDSTLSLLGWADENLGWIARTLGHEIG